MNTKKVVTIALAGLGLVFVPATVAFAVTEQRAPEPIHARTGDSTVGAHNADAKGAARGKHGTEAQGSTQAQHGSDTHGHGASEPSALSLVDSDISQADIDSLLYMVEEEKLARDLYGALAQAWDLRVFSQITMSEQQHVDTIASILDAYGVANPSASLAPGEFSIDALQELYDTLLAKGLTSFDDALAVGALVEETDIQDLRDRDSDEASVALAFDNLEAASVNHLRAFVSAIEKAGDTYTASVLSQDEVDAVVRD